MHSHVQADSTQAADVAVESRQVQDAQIYICLDENMSMIGKVVSDMSRFDSDLDSPLHLLRRHIENGNALGLHDEIRAVLEYAHSFASQSQEVLQQRELCARFENVVNQFLAGELDITEEDIMRSPHLRLLTVDERMLVKGKAIFQNIVVMDKKLRVHGHARFYDDVTFKEDVKIDGTLSVNDLVANNITVTTLSVQNEAIGCDLTVGCNISVNDSTSAAVGNIIKGGERFIHNFGVENTFVGVDSGNFTMTGDSNAGFGTNTLQNNTTGIDNTAVGADALVANTSGSENTAVGYNALLSNTIGINNTAVGSDALQNNTTGINNTAVGFNALIAGVGNQANVAVGSQALAANTADANVAVGTLALAANTTGVQNTAVGQATLRNNTIGTFNTAVGYQALNANTTGVSNTAVGNGALIANVTNSDNVAVGSLALASNMADANVAVGLRALAFNTTGIQNTALGTETLANNTIGTFNTAVGYQVLNANTTGINNTAVGNGALISATNSSNTAVGSLAGGNVTTGTSNVMVGASAGVGITTGSNNIIVGNATVFPAAQSNSTVIGNGSITSTTVFGIFGTAVGGTNAPVIVDNTGKLGTTVSSAVFKRNIEGMGIDSARIYALNPVKFIYKKDTTDTLQYGLIAEEVAKVFPEMIINDADGKPFTVRYEFLSVLLLNEFKKMANTVATLEDALASVMQQLAQFKSHK